MVTVGGAQSGLAPGQRLVRKDVSVPSERGRPRAPPGFSVEPAARRAQHDEVGRGGGTRRAEACG